MCFSPCLQLTFQVRVLPVLFSSLLFCVLGHQGSHLPPVRAGSCCPLLEHDFAMGDNLKGDAGEILPEEEAREATFYSG